MTGVEMRPVPDAAQRRFVSRVSRIVAGAVLATEPTTGKTITSTVLPSSSAAITVHTTAQAARAALVRSVRGKLKHLHGGGTDAFLRDKREDAARGY